MREIRIPLFVVGEPIEGDDVALEYQGPDGPVRVLLPAVGSEELRRVSEGPRDLFDVPLEEILDFLGCASRRWAEEDNPFRAEATELARAVTGFSPPEIALDLSYIQGILDPELCLRPMIEAEIGAPRILDVWAERGPARVRALPHGRALHLLAGNVPGVEALSFARAALTKNSSVLKVASGNPVTPSFLARLLRSIDPDHPVTRSLSVLYWPHGSTAETEAFALADAICVWGGGEAIASAWSHARPGVPFLDYGPKRSMAFVDRDATDDAGACAQVAERLAWDIAVHDQFACHSPQVAFVERPAEAFCAALAGALDRVGEQMPRGFAPLDRDAEITHLRSMCELRGDRVLQPGNNEWTIIVTDNFERTAATPLSRTLFVLEVADLRDAVPFADSATMVVGFTSKERRDQLRDAVARRGVDRVSVIGSMGLPPPGSPHECRYDLTHLVRFVGCDAGISG